MISKLTPSFFLLSCMTASAFAAETSGSGKTTRYWDCCKPSCANDGKASVTAPVKTCDKSDNPLADASAQSGCQGGTAFACNDNAPFAIDNSTAYGFAAVNIQGGKEADWCCGCYELTFTSTALTGKKMIVQASNTGGDLGGNQFDLMIPGGGLGIFDGCTAQYGSWDGGEKYGGVKSQDCDKLPEAVRDGCHFRFDWFVGAENPTVDFKETDCPSELTSISGCSRK